MNYSNKRIFLRHFKRSIKPGKTQTQQHSLNLWRRIKWLRRIFFFSREIDNVKFRRWSCSSFLMCLIPESKYRHSAFILVLLMFNPPTLIGACVLSLSILCLPSTYASSLFFSSTRLCRWFLVSLQSEIVLYIYYKCVFCMQWTKSWPFCSVLLIN